MAFKKIPLTIDTMIRNPVSVEGINQEDNIELNIVVTENKTPKDLSGQTIKVYVRRIDGTLVEQTNQITPTNARKGEVTVKLKNSAFNKEGYALFQLDVSDSIGRITSSYATFKIGKGLVSGEAIANTNEIEALKKVEEYIKKANQELETFKQTVAEINENEATRQENEVVRVREEASRNEAEAIRTQQEATRKEKENERVQAETKRIADEEVRRENEVLRGSKELERKQAEELRKEKELLRIADEKNRKVAESKRIEAESVRVEAEKLRVTGETERVGAESLRVIAEEKRVAAETKRDEKIKELENKIDNGGNNSNNEEVIQARTATTGENFDTLDERIDHEVDRLNKKIDVTMLQQEDKESHTIENAVEGVTTDMVIKGRTLQNLVNIKTYDKDKEYEFNSRYSHVLIRQFIGGKLNDKYYFKVSLTKISECTLNSKYDEQPFIVTFLGSGGYQNNHFKVKDWKNIKIGETIIVEGERQCSINENDRFEISIAIGISYEYDGSEVGTTGKFKVNDCIITKDFKANSFFEGIKSFGQEENKISILSRGKNLVKKNSFTNDEIKKWNSSDENYYVETIAGGLKQGIVCGFIESSGDIRYELSFGNNPIDITNHESIGKTREKVLQYTNGSDRNTLDKDYKYAVISVRKLSEDASISKAMISNIETSYEPYKENKKDILLNELGFDEGLRGLNNTVYDELNDIKNVAIKRIGEYTFTGNENVRFNNYNGDYILFYFEKKDAKQINFAPMCNNFKGFSGQVTGNEQFEFVNQSQNGNVFYINILKSKLTTPNVEGFKAWLKANPTTIYYELAEPVETPLSENINLKTFNEKTYVSFENAISGTSSFKAPVNTVATISRLNRENRALEEENKTLRQDFESTTLSLTDSDLELVKQNVDMDFRLMEVEFALDIPQSTLSSNINFKKKGEVKSMARTPYAMMKIVILSGDYDREDYIHKVGKYYERGRMTKEEYDELMSLMTADEVIGG